MFNRKKIKELNKEIWILNLKIAKIEIENKTFLEKVKDNLEFTIWCNNNSFKYNIGQEVYFVNSNIVTYVRILQLKHEEKIHSGFGYKSECWEFLNRNRNLYLVDHGLNEKSWIEERNLRKELPKIINNLKVNKNKCQKK